VVQIEKHTEFTFASCKIRLVLQLAVSDSRMMCAYSLEYIFFPTSSLGIRSKQILCLVCIGPSDSYGRGTVRGHLAINRHSAQHTHKLTVKQEYMQYFMLI